jgi:crotonobetainyl-CoA:carnitine CoA-transferase CaiB-like acyl-CoA transferase
MSLLAEDKAWEPFTRAIARLDLREDPRFERQVDRRANSQALIAILDEVFATRDWEDWRGRLDAEGLTFGAIATVAEAPRDQQMAAAGVIVPFDDAGVPGLRTVSSPIAMHGEAKTTPSRPPRLGEHTDEVLRSLGHDDAAIRALRARGIIGG